MSRKIHGHILDWNCKDIVKNEFHADKMYWHQRFLIESNGVTVPVTIKMLKDTYYMDYLTLWRKNLLSYPLVIQVTLDSQNIYWDGTIQNDGISLNALEGKVSLHSQSITINARSFILNAFFKAVPVTLCLETGLTGNKAVNWPVPVPVIYHPNEQEG